MGTSGWAAWNAAMPSGAARRQRKRMSVAPLCLTRSSAAIEELAVADATLSVRRGAVTAWGKPSLAYYRAMLGKIRAAGVDLDSPFGELPAKQRRIALEGGGGFEGILPGLA